MDEDFNQLICQCRRRNRAAQKDLYKQYFSYGMSICYRYVHNQDEATSILNDGFLRIFDNLNTFDTQMDFKPWFKTIMVRSAINYLKKMKKFENEVNLSAAEQVSTSDHLLSHIAYQELVAMIQGLTLAYRTVFNMYVLDGFRHEEIAKTLGISVSTSKSNLTRAKEKLRIMIQSKLAE